MHCTLTIVRYPKWKSWAGILSMAIFRFPLWLNRRYSFWKLMGSGLNGSFDIHPDWCQWALLLAGDDPKPPVFFDKWWHFFGCEKWTIELMPVEGHGTWDGEACFGALPRDTGYTGRIAVLTRATIRVGKLRSFWKNVPAVAANASQAPGMICSFGIGELPLIKQATFSIWDNKEAMKQFAYRMREHTDVIRKTRSMDWYSEEMFVRFALLHSSGTLRGVDPLNRDINGNA